MIALTSILAVVKAGAHDAADTGLLTRLGLVQGGAHSAHLHPFGPDGPRPDARSRAAQATAESTACLPRRRETVPASVALPDLAFEALDALLSPQREFVTAFVHAVSCDRAASRKARTIVYTRSERVAVRFHAGEAFGDKHFDRAAARALQLKSFIVLRPRGCLRHGTIRPIAGAEVRHLAFACRGPTHRAARFEPIGWAGGRRATARFRHVADARGGAAHRSGISGRVHAGGVDAVAQIRRAGATVIRAWRPRLQLRVNRAGPARAGTLLLGIALACGGAAHRPGVSGRVHAGGADAVAQIRRTRATIVRARRPRSRLRVNRAGPARAGTRLRGIALACGGAAECSGLLELAGW